MKSRLIITTLIIVQHLIFWSLNTQALPFDNYDYYLPANGLSPQVAATGGINLTNPNFTNTSYYNPSLLAFRKPSTVSISYRLYNEKNTELDEDQLPVGTSLSWHREALSYVGIEAQNFAFNYYSLAMLHHDKGEQYQNRNYLNYYLNGYRVAYGSESGQLAFGVNFTLLSGRSIYYSELETEDNTAVKFIDDRAFGYGFDFGAVVKSNTLAYGFFIPNLLSSIYWRDHDRQSMRRRFITGAQYGTDDSFIVTGLSRKFDFKSPNTYHIGIQQNINVGRIRGEYHEIPIRIGAYSEEPLWKLEHLNYGFGTGIKYGYFTLDISVNTVDNNWNDYYILSSISISVDQ